MEEKWIKMEGFEELSSSELMVSGGVNWKAVYEALKKAYAIAKEIDKYIPDFVEGFKDGWDSV